MRTATHASLGNPTTLAMALTLLATLVMLALPEAGQARRTVHGVAPGAARWQVRAAEGNPRSAGSLDSFSWGDVLYGPDGRALWVDGLPLVQKGRPLLRGGEPQAVVEGLLGPAPATLDEGRRRLLRYPGLVVTLRDGAVEACTLGTR